MTDPSSAPVPRSVKAIAKELAIAPDELQRLSQAANRDSGEMTGGIITKALLRQKFAEETEAFDPRIGRPVSIIVITRAGREIVARARQLGL